MAADRLFGDLLPGESIGGVLKVRPSGIGSYKHIARVAIAATIAWLIATNISQSTLGIFAPITTLLVVQASPLSTLGISAQRVAGTGLGVLGASIWVNLLGLSWWTFGLGLVISLVVARLLPFSIGGQIQIPIAVIFVMAIGPNSMEQDLWRVLDVGIGGVVGIAAVLIWPSRPPIGQLLETLASYRDSIYAVLESIRDESGTDPHAHVHGYVQQARNLRDGAVTAREQLANVSQSTHVNLRAGDIRSHVPQLALSLRRLLGFAVQVRGLAGAADALYNRRLPAALTPEQLHELVDSVVSQASIAMGAPGTPIVLAGDAGPLDSAPIATEIRDIASSVVSEFGDVAAVLESTALLGRFDYLVKQIQAYGTGEHIFDDDM
ncbi:MAG: hypothetical protein K9G69_02345 [Candidatus Nanopelagicales bacterium]|nr:hypothetical protein [Candidatus Nanopelagicales bacterium]